MSVRRGIDSLTLPPSLAADDGRWDRLRERSSRFRGNVVGVMWFAAQRSSPESVALSSTNR